MSSEILINMTPNESRVALVENGVLQEVYIERTAKRGLVGNVYKGKVSRVLPGMQAACIDVGLERAAFLNAFDIDNDGDDDYILGNFGLNSKFKATDKFPMKMYVGDFDNNKSTETIVATEKNGQYYTLSGLDELAGQLNYLKKKYTSYKTFAGQTVEAVFGDEALKKANLLTVNTLASGYLKNDKDTFSFQPFKEPESQLATITEMLKYDFNVDG